MAILYPHVIDYINKLYTNHKTFQHIYDDPVLTLAEYCLDNDIPTETFDFSKSLIKEAQKEYQVYGFLGVIGTYFKRQIVNQFIEKGLERKLLVMKTGLKALPATKAETIFAGFGEQLTLDQIKTIYASYGLANNQRHLSERIDFSQVNRRFERISLLLDRMSDKELTQKIQDRYLALRNYIFADPRSKKAAISQTMNRTLFYHYWHAFQAYGMIGLFDRSKSGFRNTKISAQHEATMVIDKIQHPDRAEKYYLEYLQYHGIQSDRSTIAKIFCRWRISTFDSKFIHNLQRLEQSEAVSTVSEPTEQFPDIQRYVDGNFINHLTGLSRNDLAVDAPGLFAIWSYIEELDIFSIMKQLDLVEEQKGYGWFDHLLYTIGRIFYGISSYSAGCHHEEPSISFFSHLLKAPCCASLLNGLDTISEDKVYQLQKWLVHRAKQLGLISGRRVAFDFHQIDIDVDYELLRQIGKGPSPNKKICWSGFRPHIAWDLDTGNLIIAEFRKSSARGPTTIRRFVQDFLYDLFVESFESVYIDSEYTGKDVWNFILDSQTGLGADLIACLKQNRFVRNQRDAFLLCHQHEVNFWRYWDHDHVFSSQTFTLQWQYIHPRTNKKQTLTLYCVVKKNINTGKLRCFGSSVSSLSAKQILEEYDYRWQIENGVKDLVESYHLDKVPGTRPNLVNVHFLIVSICRHIFRMIQRDIEDFIRNGDHTVKTLQTMRNILFRQGCGKVRLNKDTIEIRFENSFSPKLTNHLNNFYLKVNEKSQNGLKILGGFKLKYILLPPYGAEYRNARYKSILVKENF